MHKKWWKILCVILLIYTVVGGFLFTVPAREILHETIRNLYFHVCMWFGMMILFTTSVVYSVKYLRSQKLRDDVYAVNFTKVGIVFGVLGYTTGALWAKYTWTEFASDTEIFREPKLLGAAIALLIYFAYFVLRGSLTDIDKRARISAVYAIFAYAMLFPTLWILPRILDSLHPGKEGNPALNFKDSDARLRMVFYPAIIGWTLLGVWITSLKIRLDLIKERSILND
ncbi:cytochrome c biogenesis protein CcsA [Pinibacter soli]|uniref:ABC transporter permease n=1 Tax=Pinibacter soli TaxID=3044211 RepID=A0ABT6RBJ0_9BACT|nr:cytochrome c biogenesis protein CcsA [Pinibacter soli]MDI3319938.1 ABC transporter permease [Pinibacter soli]